MGYQIGICDDEPQELEKMDSLLRDWAAQRGFNVELQKFTSAETFLFEYEEHNIFDILLLDVEMRTISGLELARRVRKRDNKTEIIFVSSHPEWIGEGYEVDALHYLVKPVRKDVLFSVLDKAVSRLVQEPPTLLIRNEGEICKISEADILYIEAALHYIVIHTVLGEYTVKGTISGWKEQLSDCFYKCHRSYLVNLTRIVRISRKSVILEEGTELPLSRGLYDAIHYAFIRSNS